MKALKSPSMDVYPIIIPEKSSLKSVNFFLVKQKDRLSLIDAGLDNLECWNGLMDTLKIHGFSLKDITEIILTHHHIDHIGLVNRIISEHPIPVYAHPDSIPRLKRDKHFLEIRVDFYEQLYKEMGCGEAGNRQIHYLKNALLKNKHNALKANIAELNKQAHFHFEIIEIPGHSPDQLAFYDAGQKWIFAGDLLIEHISSNALVEPDSSGNRVPALSQQIESLSKCLALDANLVFPGHGILIENPSSLILKRLERVETKAARLFQLIESGITTGSDLALAYYKNTYYEQFSLVMSEIIGHLDYMESLGRINKERVNGVWHYTTV